VDSTPPPTTRLRPSRHRRSPPSPWIFVVGFVTDALVPPTSTACSTTCVRLQGNPGQQVLVVVVENGPLPDPRTPLQELVTNYKAKGLAIDLGHDRAAARGLGARRSARRA
jgi:hypothetical protein